MARSIPLTATKASGQLITGALWNAGPKALGDFMLNQPIFRAHQNVTQSVANVTYTAMTLDITDVDTESGHSNVTNNSRYVAQIPGWYWVEGYVAFGSGGSTSRLQAIVAKNGAFVTSTEQFVQRANDLQSCSATAIVQMSSGDYVEIWAQQSSGGALTTFAGSDLNPCLNVFWISK